MEEYDEVDTKYQPYKELLICSNLFVSFEKVITISGREPFLVGKNEVPLVWLFAKTGPGPSDWLLVVDRNKSQTKRIHVVVSKGLGLVEVRAGNVVILRVTKENDERAVIDKIDLRPIGLDIKGDVGGLNIGSNLMTGNSFRNVGTGISIG